MKSVWDWSYSGSSIVADVSYDMFTAASADGSTEYEVMIWLAALGGAGRCNICSITLCPYTDLHTSAGPISSTYGSDGSATPVATPTLAGHDWKLYKGPNGDTTVFSFIADSEITSFSGDIKTFLHYLVENEGLSNKQYLTSIGAGTGT